MRLYANDFFITNVIWFCGVILNLVKIFFQELSNK